jgi:hypothetical protein
MDADDLMFPNRLATQMSFIKENPKVAFVGTACALLTPYGHILEPILPSDTRVVTRDFLALHKRFFGDPTIVFNRHAAIEAGGADMQFPKGGVDGVALLFRLLTKGIGWELAEHLHLYRVQANSLSRRTDHAEQARLVRLKYAPEHASHYREPQDPTCGGWYTIAMLELLAGQGNAVRQAANIIRSEIPRTAHRLWVLSYLGGFGRLLYRWRNPSRYSYRHRPDWERIFSPFLLPSQKPQPGS